MIVTTRSTSRHRLTSESIIALLRLALP